MLNVLQGVFLKAVFKRTAQRVRAVTAGLKDSAIGSNGSMISTSRVCWTSSSKTAKDCRLKCFGSIAEF
ncbi:unnamed protein product, partial [Nesidiocoris tenuis]